MIVSTKDDVVRLAGDLVKNQWPAIEVPANLLLRDFPQGIIIDCNELDHVSAEGAKTFLDAMRYIQKAGARIVVCNLPDSVMDVIRSVPGVRSQLPLADSIEQARVSLRLCRTGNQDETKPTGQATILVPLVEGVDTEHAVTIAAKLSRERNAPVTLVYFLTIARHLPLGTPMADEEADGNRMLETAALVARKHNLQPYRHLEHVRDVEEGILQAIKNYHAGHLVLGAFADGGDDERFHQLVDVMLHRAPCNVLIGRKALEPV